MKFENCLENIAPRKIKRLWAAIDLNLDCNRNCSFCCNRQEEMTGSYTESALQRVVEILRDLVIKYRTDVVCFPILGGEPTLHPELPCTLHAKVKEVIPCKSEFWMYTNGDHLTHELMQEYQSRRIWITLSAADSPLLEILEKVAFLKDYYTLPRVSITLSKPNLLRLHDLVTASLENGFTIRFRHQYDSTTDQDLVSLYAQIVPIEFARYCTAPFLTKKNLIYTYEDAIQNWNEDKSPYVCGKSFFHFMANGCIRTCSGDPNSHRLGTIHDSQDIDLIQRLKQAVESGLTGRWKFVEECVSCDVKGSCQSGCPLTRKFAFNSFARKSPYCEGLYKCHQSFLGACDASC